MNIIKRIGYRLAFGSGAGKILTLMDAAGWLDALSSSGESINSANAMQSSPVAAAHRVLTNSIGNLPFKVFRRSAQGHEEDRAHSLNYVLNVRANENMTPFILKKTAMSRCLFYGRSFIYPRCDAMGRVVELIPLPSDSVRGWRDEQKRIWYSFWVDNEERKFRSDELIILLWESQNGITGLGLLDVARDAVSTDKAAQKYAGKFYRNGARISGIIEVDSQVSGPNKDKIRNEFERMASGMDNAFRAAVLDLGMKYTPLGINQKDAQFIESRNFTVEEISRFTGVPLYKMQSGKQSYEANEQQGLDYVVGVLQPIVTQWEQEFAYKLFVPREITEGYYIKANMAAELRAAPAQRAAFYEKMTGLGIYNQDDCRAMEDKNDLPDGLGKHHWMSKNYDTIENIIAAGALTATSPRGGEGTQ